MSIFPKAYDVMPGRSGIRRHVAAWAGSLFREDNDPLAGFYVYLKYLAAALASQFPCSPVHKVSKYLSSQIFTQAFLPNKTTEAAFFKRLHLESGPGLSSSSFE